MFALLSPIYRKPFQGKQVLERWVIGIAGSILFFTAAGPGQTQEYGVCMRLARMSPDEGFEMALAWTDAGGGGAAVAIPRRRGGLRGAGGLPRGGPRRRLASFLLPDGRGPRFQRISIANFSSIQN